MHNSWWKRRWTQPGASYFHQYRGKYCQRIRETIVTYSPHHYQYLSFPLNLIFSSSSIGTTIQTLSHFHTTQGEIVSKTSIMHDAPAVVFDWHPKERIVAIGWADGRCDLESQWYNPNPLSLLILYIYRAKSAVTSGHRHRNVCTNY